MIHHSPARLLLVVFLSLMLTAASRLEAAEKRPLGIDDVESWNRITETVVSPDGNWIAYKTEPWKGDTKVYLYGGNGEKKGEFDRGKNIQMTHDAEFMVFAIAPGHEFVRELKRKKTRPEDMPGDALGIYSIRSGKLESIEGIRNYRIPKQWAGWLAYQADTPSTLADRQSNEETDPKKNPAGDRLPLHLRNLATGETRSWPAVAEYHFAPDARRLFFVTTGDDAGDNAGDNAGDDAGDNAGDNAGNDQGLEAGIHLYDLETGQLVPVILGKHEYRQIAVSEKGDRLAFLLKPKDGTDVEDFSLYLWTGKGPAKSIVGHRDSRIPEGWRISEHGRVFYSGNGRRVFFGTAPVRPVRDPAILDEDYPGVDVWHGGEGLLHSVQLANRNRELRRTYLAMYDLADGSLMQIEKEDMPQSRLLDKGNADRVLVFTSKPYELQSMWDPLLHDAYLLELATGERRAIVKGMRSPPEPSPGGKYLMWFDYSDYSYYTHDVASCRQYRITTPSVIRADTETNTTFDYNERYGSPGWLADDRAVLIYDRYDIWKVDPQNKCEPVNLTVGGRADRTVYRLIRFDGTADGLGEAQPHYLIGTNEITRDTGYYRSSVAEGSKPVRLIGGAYSLSTPVKAADSDTIVYTKETFEMFPDLHVSDLRFTDSIRISDANPQQADFRWGTVELHRWTSLDGHPLEGLLYKPEGFDPSRKYPMIVHFFHKSSDQLFQHRTPQFHGSRIDYHFFVSNGYIVFNPDIHFDPGYIGESAYKSVMPGVTSLIDLGFVDPKRIGAQGHSYSGYQVAYLATRTNLFACIESGAPVVNFFSAYGGIRWESGRARVAQYEHDQTLATLWEAPMRFLENSPLFALDKVTTPILIMHNDQDGAVPWSQGIEFFVGLRRLQKPVWMLNYNGEGHGIGQLKNRRDFQIRMAQFFAHYLKDEPMPEWMRDGVPAVDKDHNLGYELTE
ncbi:MAG: S9 family peptidase [Pirellulaceae bacterium]|nr:S9 family peptidase [Pirellulaceae bacterium]